MDEDSEDPEAPTQAYRAFSSRKILAPLSRTVTEVFIQLSLYTCFGYVAKAKMNGGVISSIFALSLVFTGVIF